MRVKHDEEVSALKSNHELELLDLKKTVDHLEETIDDVRRENGALNVTLAEVRVDNSSLRNNYDVLVKRKEELQRRLREATETMQMRSIEDRKQLKDKPTKMEKQPMGQGKSRQKRKYGIQFEPYDFLSEEIPEAGHCNVSTDADAAIADYQTLRGIRRDYRDGKEIFQSTMNELSRFLECRF